MRLKSENKKLKMLAEEWAKEHPDQAFSKKGTADSTGRYAYRLAKADPALRVQSHLTVEDVVAKLGASEETTQYVKTTFDADEIKADFSGSEAKRKKVEDFGLYFTKPESHLKVEGLDS